MEGNTGKLLVGTHLDMNLTTKQTTTSTNVRVTCSKTWVNDLLQADHTWMMWQLRINWLQSQKQIMLDTTYSSELQLKTGTFKLFHAVMIFSRNVTYQMASSQQLSSFTMTNVWSIAQHRNESHYGTLQGRHVGGPQCNYSILA